MRLYFIVKMEVDILRQYTTEIVIIKDKLK